MTRAVVIAALSFLIACTSGKATAPPTTTTTTAPTTSTAPGDSTTTTSSDPGAVSSAGFRTRKKGVLLVGTERPSPPWYTGSGGEITGGFDYAIAQEIGSRIGVPVVRVVDTSLVLMMTGQDCKCDVMLGAITVTDGRARALDLTEPYLSVDEGILVRKGTALTTIAQASEMRWVVGVRNTTGLGVLNDRVKPLTPVQMVVNEDDGARLLAGNRADAMLLDLPQALAMAAADPTLAVVGQFRTGTQYAVALSLGSPNTSIVNDVVRNMRDDGIIAALFKTYLGTDPADIPFISS